MNSRTFVAIAVSSFAAASLAEATTITVPQGSGVFPTIGQVNCLEEAGGTYCAATYECAGGEESGELWGDMANHNGRRPLSVESPVARARECVIFVDGTAEATWFTAHTPAGRDGLSAVSPGMLGGHSKGAFGKCDNDLGGAWRNFNERYPSHRAKQEECCALYSEEANRIGLVLDDEPQ